MNPYLTSPLYFDPRVFPRTGHGQPRARKHRKCEANGTNCNNRPISDVIRGELVRSLYCEYHHCRMVEDGRMCRVAKPPRNERYCNEHLRCTAVDRGLRCGQRVKDEDPNRYAFCAELHLCSSDGCTGQRPGLGEEPSPFCPSHRCRVPGCREETTDKGCAIASPYCRAHTCEYQECSACVPHDSRFAGYGQRLCERHRRCGVPRCERPCHIRAGGALAPFCEAHCCDAGNCERERPTDGGKYCLEHRCVERDCRKARSGGLFCKEHKCLSRNCQQVRTVTSGYCVYHGCVSEGCDMEAGPDRYCSTHQRCVESGCAVRRFTLNGVPYPTCEDHHFGVCRGLDGHRTCGRRAAEGTSFCEDHLCVNRQCPEPRLGFSSHCHRHKCSEPDCPRPRGVVVLAAASAAATFRGEPVARLASTLPDEYLSTPYCEMHTCGRPGCRDQVAGLDSRYCIDHTPCRAQGYGRPVDLGGVDEKYYWGPRTNEREREGLRQPGRQRGRQPDREWQEWPDRGRQNSDSLESDRLDRERDLGWDARRRSHFRRPGVDGRHVEEDPWRAFGLRP